MDLISDNTEIKVLVCERSQVQRRIMCETLDRAGFAVTAVGTAAEALEKLDAGDFDLFITGIELGALNGIELCWQIKSSPGSAHLYTLVVTASDDPRRIVESLDAGADDFVAKPFDEVEIQARLRAASRIIRMQRYLRETAEVDSLTGVANRRAFMARLEEEVARSGRYAVPLSVVMLDLDRFKSVNDTHGHAVGDKVLVAAVGALQKTLREQDLIGRLGGEEFAVVLPHTGLDEAAATAERLRVAIGALRLSSDSVTRFGVSASFGVAEFNKPKFTAASLLQAADKALYAAKSAGRNRVEISPASEAA